MPRLLRLRWLRRLVTVPGVVLALALATATLPALLTLAFLVDLVLRRGSFTSVRLVLFLEAFLAIEVLGIAALAGVWLATPGDPRRRAAITGPVQNLYTAALLETTRALFALRFEVEGDHVAAEPGPVLVFIRHSSIADVLLPGVFLARRHGLRLRYVLKRELLVLPCLDIAGHFLPNHFVARDGADSAGEVAALGRLAEGLGDRDGVLIYPEGTRFSAGKRRRILDRLAEDPEARRRAARLNHLLPLRAGGSLALLDAAPGCDLLFFGHAGFEGLATLRDIWAGAMVGRTIRLKLWRARAAEIPHGRAARLTWLEGRWQSLDDWLASMERVEASRRGNTVRAPALPSTTGG